MFGLVISSCTKPPVFTSDKYACIPEITNTHPDSLRFASFLKEKVAEGLPGISMLIETPDGIWTGAAGKADIANNLDMQPCNVHRIGSMTKVFTSAVILKLHENGEFQIDDKIATFLDAELLENVANTDKATFRQLLSHTSGIPDFLDLDYTFELYNNPTKNWSTRDEIETTFGYKAKFEPGAKQSYSNTNHALLGLIAEKITGKPLEKLYEEFIFTPLGMNNSYFNQTSEIPDALVRGYNDEYGDGTLRDVTEITFAANSAAGGVASSVEDCYKFINACLTPSVLFSQSTIDLMLTIENVPPDNPDEFTFGEGNKVGKLEGISLGWFKLDTEYGIAVGHNGGVIGGRARMWQVPETGHTIIYMFNGKGAEITKVSRKIFRNEMWELIYE